MGLLVWVLGYVEFRDDVVCGVGVSGLLGFAVSLVLHGDFGWISRFWVFGYWIVVGFAVVWW